METIKEIQEQVRKNLASVRHKILIMSGKGGVGKSSFAVNLAKGLELRKKKVGLLDTDLHGPDTVSLLGVKERSIYTGEDRRIRPVQVSDRFWVLSLASNLKPEDPVIWRGPLKTSVIRQFLVDTEWGTLDYLIIDSPPGTGDEPLTVMQFLQRDLDGAVIITTPQEVALLDTRRSISFARNMQIRILGLIENMSYLICPYCGSQIAVFGSGGGKRLSEEMGVELIGTIPFSLAMMHSSEKGQTIWDLQEDVDVVRAYNAIIDRILQMVSSEHSEEE